MGYLAERLPDELVQSLSVVMMPDLIPRIKSVWLDSIVPSSLKEIEEFQGVLDIVRSFCTSLRGFDYTGFDDLQSWVDNAPQVWLRKCKETALDTVRTKLAQGLGNPKEVERVETQTVSRSEGAELAANGAPATTDDDDWGAAWDEGGDDGGLPENSQEATGNNNEPENEDDGGDAWGAWGEDDGAEEKPVEPPKSSVPEPHADDDDGGDDWGAWDDATAEKPAQPPAAQQPDARTQTREMTLRETYKISSMPEPVLALITAILEDGAFLIQYVPSVSLCGWPSTN